MIALLPEALRTPVSGLFSVCVVAAAMDVLTQDERAALSFRAVCALACALCAMRVILRFIE